MGQLGPGGDEEGQAGFGPGLPTSKGRAVITCRVSSESLSSDGRARARVVTPPCSPRRVRLCPHLLPRPTSGPRPNHTHLPEWPNLPDWPAQKPSLAPQYPGNKAQLLGLAPMETFCAFQPLSRILLWESSPPPGGFPSQVQRRPPGCGGPSPDIPP